MRVVSLLFTADFIRHAPVAQGFEGPQDLPDFFMGPTMVLWVVKGQLPFAGRHVPAFAGSGRGVWSLWGRTYCNICGIGHSYTVLQGMLHVTEVRA